MLVRIVKLTFEPAKIEAFQELFERTRDKIRDFEGNEFLELYQDKDNKHIFFTYSYWQNEEALENYRNSAFFKEVWSETKQMFSGKPEAWSLLKV